jgi:hypothetical protein
MKVSGSLKRLIKKIHYIKNLNLEATDERVMLDTLRAKHTGNFVANYDKAWEKHMKEPWSRLMK